MKTCLAASAGGHLTQLLRLSPIWEGRQHFYVTTDPRAFPALGQGERAYSVGWGNRRHPFLLLKMVVHCAAVVIRERPNVLISTGAVVGCIMAYMVKLRRGKVIWIDTISHASYLTLSGRIVRPVADLFLVQWPELTHKYPGTTYVGSII